MSITDEQPPESIGWIEKMAYVVALRGPEFEKEMIIVNRGDTTFSFMSSSDPNHALYQQKLTEYQGGKPPDFQPNTPEPKGKAQSYDLEPPPSKEPRYTEISRREKELYYSASMPPPERLSVMMNRVTLSEPDMLLQLPLGSQLASVRKQYKLYPFDDACTETVLEDFFRRLQLEKLAVEEEAMIDLHAFVSGVDYFADLEDVDYYALMPPPELLSIIMNRMRGMRKWLPLEYRRMYPPIPYTHGQCADSWYPHCPCTHGFADPSTWLMQTAGPEEPETKRQKFDESALVPERTDRRRHSRWQ
ncbi:unnamed protein product [Arabidopsis halleri]